MDTKKVIIWIVIIILILLAVWAVFNFTGQAIKAKYSCTDTDEGMNTEKMGLTQGFTNDILKEGPYEDECVSGRTLKEYYCDENNRVRSVDINCVPQSCVMGTGVCKSLR